jgi:hypothetical protein
MRQTSDFWAIQKEQGSVIVGTVRMFPLQVVRDLLIGTARQLVTIDSGTQFDEYGMHTLARYYNYAGPRYPESLQGQGKLGDDALVVMNRLHAAVVLIGVVLSVPLAAACMRRRLTASVVLLAAISLGLVAKRCRHRRFL